MLSLKTGWSLSEIDTMPLSQFNAYRALNYIMPYTHDAQAEREGLLITETLNQRRKKQLKSHDIFPYLKTGTPDWLSDSTVKKARQVIENINSICKITKLPANYDYINLKINEEIEIETSKKSPDLLKIKELRLLVQT